MIKLSGISTSWPVQYEAFLDGKQVGYLRLSDGRFTVEFPDRGGEVIYSAVAKGQGEFMDDEQDHYLRFAVDAITATPWRKTTVSAGRNVRTTLTRLLLIDRIRHHP